MVRLEDLKQNFSKETNGQKQKKKKKKRFSKITNYQKNPNQNHNEVPPHTSQNGHPQNDYKQ